MEMTSPVTPVAQFQSTSWNLIVCLFVCFLEFSHGFQFKYAERKEIRIGSQILFHTLNDVKKW